MLARWVNAVRTPATPEAISRAYKQALSFIVGKAPPEAVAVLHAHGALETGRFAACWNHNAGNIKASVQYPGLYCTISLNEVLVRNGKRTVVWFDPRGELTSKNGSVIPGAEWEDPPGHPQTRMRAYESLGDGILDKVRFLRGMRYAPALDQALSGNPGGFVDGIHGAGYFTADPAPYRRAVESLYRTYLPLAKRETVEPVELPPEHEEQLCQDMAECMRVELPEWLVRRVAQTQALTASEMYDRAAELIRKGRDQDVRGNGGRDK